MSPAIPPPDMPGGDGAGEDGQRDLLRGPPTEVQADRGVDPVGRLVAQLRADLLEVFAGVTA